MRGSRPGAKVLTLPQSANGTGVDLTATLETLAGLGVLQAMFEGGAQVAGALLEAGLVDRLRRVRRAHAARHRRAPGVRDRRSADDRRARPGGNWSTSPASAPTSGSPTSPTGPCRRRRLMFTGIVEELGTRAAHHPSRRWRAASRSTAHRVLDDAEIGASIAVNGCCLTVVELGDDWWAADAVTETLDRTALGALATATRSTSSDRCASPTVSVVTSCRVTSTRVGTSSASTRWPTARCAVEVAAPPDVMRYVVEKGSITVDGISLTVAALADDGFSIAVIPHTLAVTTLGAKGPGDPVNLEVDVVAKYVERLMATQHA